MKNTMNESENIESYIKSQLDQSIQNLDAATVSKLNQARHKALDNIGKKSPYYQWLLPAGSFAIMLLVVSLQFNPFVSSVDDMSTPPSMAGVGLVEEQFNVLGDLEILASSEDLDLYEDLEFYAWLEEELQQAG